MYLQEVFAQGVCLLIAIVVIGITMYFGAKCGFPEWYLQRQDATCQVNGWICAAVIFPMYIA